MGWADCGTDSTGRPIGYAFEATCDEPGCTAKIDRGLSYACGGMHGDGIGCEKYFCEDHLRYLDIETPWEEGVHHNFCAACRAELEQLAREEKTS